MRKTPAAKATRPDGPLTFSPLTDLQRIAGEPLKGTTKDGTEVLFGQIALSDLAAFESEVGSMDLIGDAAHRVTSWSFLALRSLQHHRPETTPADVDALFPPTAHGIDLLGEVVSAVLPTDEPADEPAEAATGDSS